jgi:hypothetical protein
MIEFYQSQGRLLRGTEELLVWGLAGAFAVSDVGVGASTDEDAKAQKLEKVQRHSLIIMLFLDSEMTFWYSINILFFGFCSSSFS